MAHVIKNIIEATLPASWFQKIVSSYHFLLTWVGAILNDFPARQLLIVGVTGTKGKTTVTEMINAILEEAACKTCLINSIRFKIGDTSEKNRTRMSMPGRFFIQRFLRRALREGCSVAIIEMTSEGARQHRHRCTEMDALVFLNLAPEHIESHGSYQNYADAKFELARELLRSRKRPRIIVANADDAAAMRYLTLPVENILPFSLSISKPFAADERGGYFTFEENRIEVDMPGEFSLKNAIAAATLARAVGISKESIKKALERFGGIPGRIERLEAGQDFTVIIDYAHTPDSLSALYESFTHMKKICVLGAAGGGRDVWKRPTMGRIAEKECAAVILTNEDPFDENPQKIVEDIARGMTKPPTVYIDRREAIAKALEIALGWSEDTRSPETQGKSGIAVLITGKGSESSIAGAKGSTVPWSDTQVAREELQRLLKSLAV